jgi:hypothetical protein
MEQEPPIDYATLEAEAQRGHVPLAEPLAFYETEAHRLCRCGCDKVDPLHGSRLPLEPPGGRGSCVPGCGDALRETGPKHGETAAAQSIKEPAVPEQNMRTPACQ